MPEVRTGAREGDGPPPGLRWGIEYLSIAREEACRFLTDGQYAYLVECVRALAREERPTHPVTVSVDAIDDFWELREKGGPLGRINVRVFFTIKDRTIVVIGAIKKENEGATPPATKRIMARRRHLFLSGQYSRPHARAQERQQ